MVRQPYMTRLALGRSAFEPPEWPQDEGSESEATDPVSRSLDLETTAHQRVPAEPREYLQTYDTRGHPENRTSRSLGRRLRRAQNDILATVGVCVSVDKHGQLISAVDDESHEYVRSEKLKLLSVISENEVGFWLGAGEVAAFALCASCITGLRHRIQTFKGYAGIPLTQIIRDERLRFGVLRWLFAGAVASFTYELLEAGRTYLVEEFRDRLVRRFAPPGIPAETRNTATRVIDIAEQIFEVVTMTAIAPIEIFAILQRLNLVPAWPLLPNPLHYSFKSLSWLLLPPLPTQWNLRSSLGFAIGIGLSPVSLFLGLNTITIRYDSILTRYARIALPRPNSPDDSSMKGYRQEPSGVYDSAMTLPRLKSSVVDELKRDLKYTVGLFVELRDRLHFDRLVTEVRKAFQLPNDFLHGLRRSNQRVESRTEVRTQMPPSATSDATDRQNFSSNAGFELGTIAIPESDPSTAAPSPHPSVSSEEEEDAFSHGLDEHNRVQLTTRVGSSDTLHMHVEVNGAAPGDPVFTSSFSASPRATVAETVIIEQVEEERHRVTALTLHPSDSLAQHIVNDLVNIAALPIETFMIRTVASAYLAAAISWRADVARTDVYPRSSWFGVGLRSGDWRGMAEYSRKMLLSIGLESAIGFCVWEVGVGFAWGFGKKWYQWGHL